MPIKMPAGVEAKVDGSLILVKGPRGELKQELHRAVKIEIDSGNKIMNISVNHPDDHRERALWGLFRSIIFNMVEGVTHGFEKKLEINGIGYKASVSGSKLVLNVGYSHPVNFALPIGINCKVENNVITFFGCDKQVVGEVAANVRRIREPEPYQGKGIKYADEVIRRKAGKAAAKAA